MKLSSYDNFRFWLATDWPHCRRLRVNGLHAWISKHARFHSPKQKKTVRTRTLVEHRGLGETPKQKKTVRTRTLVEHRELGETPNWDQHANSALLFFSIRQEWPDFRNDPKRDFENRVMLDFISCIMFVFHFLVTGGSCLNICLIISYSECSETRSTLAIVFQ
jgi:hypothetical protein